MGFPMGPKRVKSGTTLNRLSGTHISEAAVWIYTEIIWNCLNLQAWNIMGLLPWHWIFRVKCWKSLITDLHRNYMELSKPASVEHHGLVTLTLDFQGEMLKKPYHGNSRVIAHRMKWVWIDRKWDTLYGTSLCSFPILWHWFCKAKFKKEMYFRNRSVD